MDTNDKNEGHDQATPVQLQLSKEMEQLIVDMRYFRTYLIGQEREKVTQLEWRLLAGIIDRVCLILFVIACVVLSTYTGIRMAVQRP